MILKRDKSHPIPVKSSALIPTKRPKAVLISHQFSTRKAVLIGYKSSTFWAASLYLPALKAY